MVWNPKIEITRKPLLRRVRLSAAARKKMPMPAGKEKNTPSKGHEGGLKAHELIPFAAGEVVGDESSCAGHNPRHPYAQKRASNEQRNERVEIKPAAARPCVEK